MHHIKNAVISTLAISGLILLWSFAARENKQLVCNGHYINIHSTGANYFINKHEVEYLIFSNFDTLQGQYIDQEKLHKLHKLVQSMDYTDHATVYRTMNGTIGIDIRLREPLFRVINRSNESFYIDLNGYMFPLSDEHTARVLLATGSIDRPFTSAKNINTEHPDYESSTTCELAAVYELAAYIHKHPFWKAFIDHIYVLPDGKLELIPKTGAHVIEFGYAEKIDYKFRKLKLFYLNGLPGKGWHVYNRINLEYKNQIVCSK